MKKYNLLIPALLLVHLAFAQTNPGLQWQRSLGGAGSENPAHAIVTADGGYLLLSETDTASNAVTGSHGGRDIWVVKLNALGGIEWQKSLGGSQDDRVFQSLLNADGTIIIFGSTLSNNLDVSGNHGARDIWLVKLSAGGTILWQRCYGGTQIEEGKNALINAAGNIVFAATTLSGDGDITNNHSPGSRTEMWVVEASNTNGAIVAQSCYGGSQNDTPSFIMQQADGKYLLTGFTTSNDGDVSGLHVINGTGITSESDTWLAKLSSITTLEWQRCLGSNTSSSGFETERGHKIINAENNSIVLLAQACGSGGDITNGRGGNDIWVVKLSATGTLLWQRSLGGTKKEIPFDIYRNTTDSTLMVLGYSSSADGDVTGQHVNGSFETGDLWLVKLSTSGLLLWQRAYGGTNDDAFSYASNSQLLKQPDGGYVLLTSTNSSDGDVTGFHAPSAFPGDTASDSWILKVSNLNGAIEWQRCLGGNNVDYSRWITPVSPTSFLVLTQAFSRNGDVSGPWQAPASIWDSWVVKLGAVNRIRGIVFIDNNNNGIKDPGERFYQRGEIRSEKPGYARSTTPTGGVFVNEVDTGSYNTTLVVPNTYYTVTPAQRSSSFTSYFQSDSFSFRLVPIPNKNDLLSGIIAVTPARPGFNARYKLWYENAGTTTLSGTLRFVKDSRTGFVSSQPSPSSISGDTLFYNYAALAPTDTASINIVLSNAAPPQLNINDTLRMFARINPVTGDETPLNNDDTLVQVVRGAYDPNDKTEGHGQFISPAEINGGEYLSYLVRFQNTGNDTAFRVVIRDTLDAKLQWNKLDVMTASHPYTVQVTEGRYLAFTFDNIRLVDSFRNEPASHGYLYFRIKPQAGLVVNDTIRNSASIYFDFNQPVKTNTALTVVRNQLITAVSGVRPGSDWTLTAYPNPARGKLQLGIKGNIYGNLDLVLMNTAGHRVLHVSPGKKTSYSWQTQTDLSGLTRGVYYLSVTCDQQTRVVKLVLE